MKPTRTTSVATRTKRAAWSTALRASIRATSRATTTRHAAAWAMIATAVLVAACGDRGDAPAAAPAGGQPAAAPTIAVVTPAPLSPYTGGAQTAGNDVTTGAGASNPLSPTTSTTDTIGAGTRPEDLLPGPAWLWRGTLITGGTQHVPDDPSKYSLSFSADGTLTVGADCNQASGTFTLDGSKIAISGLNSTLAACPAGSLSAEFIADLGLAKHVVVSPAVLSFKLETADGKLGEMKLLRAGLR